MEGHKHSSRWRPSMWQPIRSDMPCTVGAYHSYHRDALGREVRTDTNFDTNWNEQRRTAADNSFTPALKSSGVLDGDEHGRAYCLELVDAYQRKNVYFTELDGSFRRLGMGYVLPYAPPSGLTRLRGFIPRSFSRWV